VVSTGSTTGGNSVVEAGASTHVETTAPGTVSRYDKQLGLLIACGDGYYAARRLQYSTKKALPAGDFLNGAKDIIGAKLT
jgi:methionyl-tRNA formyltransferase